MKRRIVLGILSAGLAGSTAADGPPPAPPSDETTLDLASVIASMRGPGVAAVLPDGPARPDFAEVTKGMTATKGLFTLWHYPPSVKDKDPERLLAQIPARLLGEKFMLSTSVAGGGFFTGFPLDERVVQWELLGEQLVLVEPETRFVVKRSQEVSDVVRRTYPERIRAAVPLVTRSPGGDPVIDLGRLLKSEFADIGWITGALTPFGFSRGGSINASLSKWTAKKSFELNVEVGVELAVSRSSPPGSYDKKLIHYSFWKLPKSDYRPRVADDRVGYFLTANQDWAKPTAARDLFNRYIDRWHLEKRDPSLALCEPKQPIIFYIEKTVPVRFRRAVRDGILEWNKAFETVGFSNAVVVRQQTDDNEWKDLDPEDMRYSFFRWIVTGAGFAMGPHRANPFTGQIYDADIVFDDSMVRYFEHSAEQMLAEGAMSWKVQDPALQAFFEANPEWRRPTRDWEHFFRGDDASAEIRQAMRHRMHETGRHTCEYIAGMKHQMALARTILRNQPKEVVDRFLYDAIKEVVMHEVGHTLGLRHNFKASSVWSLDEIRTRYANGEATTGSVMDYNPALFFADGRTDGAFLTPTIGPYDYWAIEYGYRPYDAAYRAAAKAEPAAPDEPAPTPDTPDTAGAPDTPDTADTVDTAVAAMPPAEPDAGFHLDQLPPDLLAQMPDDMKARVTAMMAARATGSGPSAPARARPDSPAFSSAPAGEAGMLRAIAGRAAEPELAYATDEDTTFLGTDPRSNRFDVSADPVDWARDRIELVDGRLATILDWAVEDAESWYHVTSAYLNLLAEKAFILDYVGRSIGGQYFSRSHRGDADAPAPFVLVDTETQRAALDFIEETLYSDDFFAVPPEVLNHLAPPRWWHEGAYVSYTMDFPVHDIVGILQWWNLFDRLYPNTLRRIQDAEWKTADEDRLTVAEYLQRIQNACWARTTDLSGHAAGTWSDTNPYVPDVRRSLQREYLALVERLVRTRPGRVLSPDLHAMVSRSVQQLAEKLDVIIDNGTLDFASAAHLHACKSRMDRMLEAQLNEF